MRKMVCLACVTAVATSATLPLLGGVKYWDNPDFRAFDVGDYAPGAVWHYDGIDNTGTGTHDSTATTWVNLGSSGSGNDMFIRLLNQAGNGWYNGATTTEPLASLGTINERNTGSWAEKGFMFTGDSELRSKGSISSGTSYTIQMLVNGAISSQTRAKPYLMSVQQNNFAFYVDRANSKLCWGVENSSASDDPFMSGDTLGYVTAILNGTDKTAAFFSGTTIPTGGDGFQQFSSLSGKTDSGYCLCGYTGTDGFFKGTMYSYRYYTRVLTEEELAWNRVVDEARFFNRVAPLPMTNAVIATAVAGVEGAEPHGTYAVDVRHTFTAPATVNVDGIDYVCTGYTVETRSGDGWSEPVFHKAALYQPCAFVVSEGDCVRLTWQWAKAAGLKNLGYTVNDYVWDGLETFYDGICNVGTNLPHSYTAMTWVNLGSTGSVNNVFVQRLNAAGTGWETAADLNPVGERDPGYWTENGFRMDAESRLRCNTPGGFALGTGGNGYSLQSLIDARVSEQESANAYLFGLQVDYCALLIQKNSSRLVWRVLGSSASHPLMSGDSFDYVTAIMDPSNKQTLFSGTTIPTSGNGCKANASASFSESGFCLGGYTREQATDRFVGTMKFFRQYNHALSAEEVAQNRKVDNWRYFGIPDDPDVIVQSTVPYLRGDEPDGSYAVDVSHTFTAPATVTAKGITYACDGYTVETWRALADKGDGWSAATHYTGNTYAYSASTGKVRLTWKWKATRGLRTAADYSYDDYSQAGIVWHFDGIYNQGVGVDRSTTATTWKNLAPNPVTGQIFIQRVNSNKNGYANNDSTILGSLIETDGNWTENDKGFTMKGTSRWRGIGQMGPVANWTLQTLVDADVNDISDDIEYVISASWLNFATVLRKTGNGPVPNSCYFNAQDAQNVNTRPYFQNASGEYDFATAILDSSDRTAKMFSGVTPPTSGGIADGYYQYSSITPYKDNNFGIGAPAGSYVQFFIGTLKNIRYYDRVLTEEEIVRNRNVDAVRYYGALGVTNVFVVAGENGIRTETAYKVEGEWTFTAVNTVNSRGDTIAVTRYSVEELVNGAWTNKATHDGTSYTYTEGTDPATVRLTWLGPPSGAVLLVR